MSKADYGKRVHEHVHSFFSGHEAYREDFDEGPIQSLIPGFHSIVVEPGPKLQLWTYVSVGAGMIEKDNASRLEFLIAAAEPSDKYTERLAMTAYYHETQTLGLGHTFPLGEPWTPDSILDHALVSLPYPYGEELEVFNSEGDHVHFFWILPITEREYSFKIANGLEALESAFDEAELRYWDVRRKSVV